MSIFILFVVLGALVVDRCSARLPLSVDNYDPPIPVNPGYIVTVDCGTKGSRVFIYYFDLEADHKYQTVYPAPIGGGDPWAYKVTPSLAAYASDPQNAGNGLKPLLDYALQKNLPSNNTYFTLGATEIFRELPSDVVSAIMSSVQDTVAQYPFKTDSNYMGVISGQLEGIYGWIAANQLQQNFDKGCLNNCKGTLDLGSGSAEITFLGDHIPPEGYNFDFTWGAETFHAYTHSFGGVGYILGLQNLNISLASSSTSYVVQHPCLLQGYNDTWSYNDKEILFVGSGSFEECLGLVKQVMNVDAPCPKSPCSFDGAYQPALRGMFDALSNYRDVEKFLEGGDSGLHDHSVGYLQRHGSDFCSMAWNDALDTFGKDYEADELSKFCYGSSLTYGLLKGFGFSDDDHVEYDKKINGIRFSWTLGAAIQMLRDQYEPHP